MNINFLKIFLSYVKNNWNGWITCQVYVQFISFPIACTGDKSSIKLYCLFKISALENIDNRAKNLSQYCFGWSISGWSISAFHVTPCSVFSRLFVCFPFFFPFLCVYRKGSVIAEMELTFNEKVGASEVQALLSELTKDGTLGDLEVSQVVTGPSIEGQLFLITNICEPLI